MFALIFFLPQIHRATAAIIEPTGESDNPLRFTSGLVLALDIDATLEHVQDPQNTVKVQVSGGTRPALGPVAAALVTSFFFLGNVHSFRFSTPMARVM